MNDSMKTKMEELITKFSTDKIKVSENLSIEHRDKYDARIYEEGFVDCYDLTSSEVKNASFINKSLANRNADLNDQLKIAREALERIRNNSDYSRSKAFKKEDREIFDIIFNDSYKALTKLSNTEGGGK